MHFTIRARNENLYTLEMHQNSNHFAAFQDVFISLASDEIAVGFFRQNKVGVALHMKSSFPKNIAPETFT